MNGTRMSAFFKLSMRDLKYDIPSSIVVFLVALPLCLGIALASGAPLLSGLLTGIIGGIVVASISGSQLSVCGPAAGLTVIVLGAIESLGAYNIFLLAVVLAGAIQLVLGMLKAGNLGQYFPSAVITGMLAAIGISIILQQLPIALGSDAPIDFSGIPAVNITSLAICALSILILIWWPRLKLTYLPAPLLVVLVGIGGVVLLKGTSYALTQDQLVNIPRIESLAGFRDLFIFPDFSQILNKEVWTIAFTIAIIASIETLLSIEAIDKLDPQKRVSPTNRELFAQGIGNMGSGLIGGLPLTSVIVRSSANVMAGGRTRQSAILHGIWLLVALLVLANVINLIPLASLAAVLLVTGYKLANAGLFKTMYQRGTDQFVPFMATVIAVLLSDLLTGVAIGIVVAILFLLRNNMRNRFSFQEQREEGKHQVTVQLLGEVSFLNKAAFRRSLRQIPRKAKEITIDGRQSRFIDKDVILLIQEYESTARNQGKKVQLIEVYDKKSSV